MAKSSKTMLNSSSEIGHPCLVPGFRGNAFNFSPLRIMFKKNTFESVLMRWVKLEPIVQSEVSQKEKHLYSILMHIYGI